MSQSVETVALYDGEYTAYPIAVGNTYVTLKPGRNFFLYTPTASGEYEMFTTNDQYKVSYLGGKSFFQDYNIGRDVGNNGTGL